MQHICIERRKINVLTTKGDKPRTVPIPDAVFAELLAYLHERGGKRGPLLKTNIKKTRVRQENVGHAVPQAVLRAGLSKDITPKTIAVYDAALSPFFRNRRAIGMSRGAIYERVRTWSRPASTSSPSGICSATS